jgi:phage terminase large subunit
MQRRVVQSRSVALALAVACDRVVQDSKKLSYPLERYRLDPYRYVKERLHVETVLPHQKAILEAVGEAARGKAVRAVAIRSGQKCGKTALAIWVCLWFYECFDNAKVWLCAAIEAQTKNVLWGELGDTLRRAKAAGEEIDGELAKSPAGGLISTDGARAIKGIHGREVESIAGLSGRQLFVIDEASHLAAKRAEVFDGNSMGPGCFHFWISNPTRNAGPFYEAFHSQKRYWQTFHIDAEKIARWQADHGVRAGFTADMATVDMFREKYGEGSPFWLVRVKGEWLRNETGRAISMDTIEAARERWREAEGDGVLTIGYDCAGPGAGGDEHCWAIRRGDKCLAIERARGLTEDQALVRTYGLMEANRRGNELPRLIVDAEGPIGGTLYGRLKGESEHRRVYNVAQLFEVFGIKASSPRVREPEKFERVRDEIVWVLGEWMKTGAIPPDDKLEAELYAPMWKDLVTGKIKITPKPALRDELGRSPDSFDALALAVWTPVRWMTDEEEGALPRPPRRTNDPYDANDTWFDGQQPGGAGDDPWWPKE